MNLEQLQQSGGLVSDELVKRTGQWRDQDVEFYVRKLAFGDVDRAFSDDDKSRSAELIRMGIRLGDDGEQSLTYDQAYRLDAGLASVFADAIMEVNGIDDEAAGSPKASPRKKNSGSKSRKASEAQ